jgi:hypothetical protein
MMTIFPWVSRLVDHLIHKRMNRSLVQLAERNARPEDRKDAVRFLTEISRIMMSEQFSDEDIISLYMISSYIFTHIDWVGLAMPQGLIETFKNERDMREILGEKFEMIVVTEYIVKFGMEFAPNTSR